MEAAAGRATCQAANYCNVAVLDKCRQKCSFIYIIKSKPAHVETSDCCENRIKDGLPQWILKFLQQVHKAL